MYFTEFSTKIHWNTRLVASDVFHMFTQSVKFFWFHFRTDVWKTWFIKETVKLMITSFSNFYGKIWVGFCLNIRNAFSYSFHFKANRKSIDCSKNGTRDFQNSPPFEMWQSVRVLNVFKTLTSNFLENENLFQKNWSNFFGWNH